MTGSGTDSAEALKAVARRKTGLDDFGPEPFEESLERLLCALRSEAQLHAAGLAALEARLLDSLEQRLRIQAAIVRHPEILSVPVADPVLITGLNRTGTTKLHRMLATHPGLRTQPLWEALNPLPLPGEARGENIQRVSVAEAMVEQVMAVMPAAHAGHPIFAREAEEETYSSQMQLQWCSWYGYAHVPSYMNWVLEASMADGYRWLRKVMQVMVWANGGGGRRWLIKAPFHLGYLDDLFAVFPDLRIIHCHRQPLLEPVASIAALVACGRPAFSERWDQSAMGPEFLGYLSRQIQRTGVQRVGLLDRIYDVDYRDTFGASDALLGDLCQWLGLPFGPDERQRVAQWETRNPQHAHGRFSYAAAESGLDAARVDAAFGGYARWVADFMQGDGRRSRPAAGQPTW